MIQECTMLRGVLYPEPQNPLGQSSTTGFAEALGVAERADVVVMCLGLSPTLEGGRFGGRIRWGGDRMSLGLPGMQEELLRSLARPGNP